MNATSLSSLRYPVDSTKATSSELTYQNPYQLLQQLVDSKATGKLIIHSPFDEFVSWQVYLGNGKIHFASSGVGITERLQYLLSIQLHQQAIKLPKQLNDDYSYLCDLWKDGIFSFQQIRSLLTQFTQEALVQILSLPRANCSFDQKDGLKYLFLNLNLEAITQPLKLKIRYWWELHSEISSPFQRPLVNDWKQLKSVLIQKYDRGGQWLEKFSDGLKNLSCLYEIAAQTRTSTLQLALMLRPQIKRGDITMLSYQDIQVDKRPLVVCVDNKPAMQRMVKFTLEASGYKTTAIQDPFKVLAGVMSLEPSLILIDANMPEINGYELCRLLRKSDSLETTPIILLNDRQTLVNNIRGKLAGASGTIIKPFLPHELVKLLDSHLKVVSQDTAPAMVA